MITMLINLSSPNQASDTDNMLSQADITQMNDLENIKKNRNKILHDRNVTLDSQSFGKIWDEISRVGMTYYDLSERAIILLYILQGLYRERTTFQIFYLNVVQCCQVYRLIIFFVCFILIKL